MNPDFIYKVLPLYKDAAVLTLQVGFIGIFLSVLIGLVCSLIRYYKVPFLTGAVAV